MNENAIGDIVVETAVSLHRDLGPGLLESVYEVTLEYLLTQKKLKVQRQLSIPVVCRNIKFDEGFRIDLLLNSKVILELKSVEKVNNAHKKQLLTYLRLTNCRLGYILNFGSALMKDGIHRIVNQLEP